MPDDAQTYEVTRQFWCKVCDTGESKRVVCDYFTGESDTPPPGCWCCGAPMTVGSL